jgi:hypothetical protein
LDSCDLQGNYRGTVGPIDVVSDLPEYACIAADVSGGAISALEITQPFVGTLIADGVHSLNFAAAGGTGATATFTVTGGYIVSTSLTAGGSGYTTSKHRTRRATWTGQRKMVHWLPWGIRGSDSSGVSGIVVQDCTFDTLANAFKPGTITGSVTSLRNTFTRTYMDVQSFGLSHPTAPYPLTVAFNFSSLPFSLAQKDAGDPHSDVVQLFGDDLGGAGNVTTANWNNILVYGNVHQDGPCRGSVQGMIIADMPSGTSFSGSKFVGNHIASNEQTLGLAITNPRDCYIYANNCIRHDHTNTVRNVSPVQLRVPGFQDDPGGGYYPSGSNLVGHNIVEAFDANGFGIPEINGQRYSNTILGAIGATIAYPSVFTAPTGARATLAQIKSAYTPTGIYSAKGAFGSASPVDVVNRTYDLNLEPTFVQFVDVVGQAINTQITSNWSRIIGGPATRSISVSGASAQWRQADDASGTNATAWTSSNGTLTIGKFLQIRATSGADGASVTATVTIGSEVYSWGVTSLSTASYVAIDNGGTARSNVSALSTDTGIRKVAIAFRMRPDVITAGASLFADAADTTCRVWFPTVGAFRGQFFGSPRAQLRPVLTPTTVMKTHIITLDFTNPNAGQGCSWATVEDGILLNNTHGGGVFDTRSVPGSGSDYGAASLQASGATSALFHSAGDFGIFNQADGGGTTFDGAFEFMWIDWGNSGYTIPDITQASIRNRWSAGIIGANGNGPTGSQPKCFWTATDLAEANSGGGMPNLGSISSKPLVKQAGTYT